MLKDEYNQLIKLFHDGAEGKTINLDEVFAQSLTFFNHLKAQVEKGSPEEKKEAVSMMSEMYNQMIAETKKITERSGVPEDQLLAYAENPSNFTPEQWQQIQQSKQKIAEAGKDLMKAFQNLAKGASPSAETEEKKGKKSKKSQWMRS